MLNVSIVLYRTPASEVQKIVSTLRLSAVVDEIWLIDNSEIQTEAYMFLPATYIFNNKNLGYGAAHNIAIRKSLASNAKYHLVINSDISFEPEILKILIDYLDINEEVGQLMPLVRYPSGEIQYLAKLLPTPYDLIIRRFLPACITRKRTSKYELHNIPLDQPSNIAYLSGCFMLFRCSTLQQIGLFDERYFMYPEDIDITRRVHKQFRTEFYPQTEIIHNHAQSSYKNYKMLWVHIVNICKYFNKWGWILDSGRRRINKQICRNINDK